MWKSSRSSDGTWGIDFKFSAHCLSLLLSRFVSYRSSVKNAESWLQSACSVKCDEKIHWQYWRVVYEHGPYCGLVWALKTVVNRYNHSLPKKENQLNSRYSWRKILKSNKWSQFFKHYDLTVEKLSHILTDLQRFFPSLVDIWFTIIIAVTPIQR